MHTHAPLAEVEREWEVGMRLNQLAEEDGSLPGFMGVGAGEGPVPSFQCEDGLMWLALNIRVKRRRLCASVANDLERQHHASPVPGTMYVRGETFPFFL